MWKREQSQCYYYVDSCLGGTEEDHVAMREIYEEFQEENPDINLQMISMPTREDMMRKVEDMIMVGNIPDIVSFSGTGENNTYDFMIENNMALDIYPYMQQDQEFADSISEVNKEYWSNRKWRVVLCGRCTNVKRRVLV